MPSVRFFLCLFLFGFLFGLTMTAAHQLSSVTLPATNGTTIRLGDLWSESTTVLVFLRHYG